MDTQSLPVVPFGKYKGEPVTSLLADTKYLEWCKQQDFFKKYPVVYNICVNQTIQSNQPSKTPEHNKLQNRFLKRSFLLQFVNYLYKLDVTLSKLEQLYFTEEYKKYFGEQRFSTVEFGLENLSLRPVFEADFNWDVMVICGDGLYGDGLSANCVGLNRNYDNIGTLFQNFAIKRLEGDCHPITFRYEIVISSALYIEIKPLIGDDYPNVLRKMSHQIKLTDIEHEKRDKEYRSKRYILLIGEFVSSVTTKEELVMIFRQSNIRVMFMKDISNGLQNKPLEETKLLQEKIIEKLQQELLQSHEKIKQLEELLQSK